MFDKGVRFLLKLLLVVPYFILGMSSLWLGLLFLVQFGTDVQTWANTGAWPKFTMLELFYKFSIPIPHTEMIGVQNVIDGLLSWSGNLVLFVLAMSCLGLSQWIGDLIDRLTPKQPMKTKKPKAGPWDFAR
jgi:hypothetical protein